MDLKLDGAVSELDAAKMNDGVWISLDSAIMGDDGQYPPLLLNGDPSKPQRALVRSHRCKAIKDAEAAQQKTGFVKIRVAKKKDRDGVIAENTILKEDVRFSLFLVALDNFGTAGGVQHVKPEDARALYNMTEYDNIVQQIKEAAYDDNNYRAGPETEAGNGSAPIQTAQSKSTATTSPDLA